MTTFRSAIDSAKEHGDERINWLSRFPVDCCDHVSQQLFIHLYRHGFRRIIKARATLSDDYDKLPEFHVWLEICDIIIDITADQFELGLPKVIVSDSSEWHTSHEVVEREICGEYNGRDQAAYFDELVANHVTGHWHIVLCEWVILTAN